MIMPDLYGGPMADDMDDYMDEGYASMDVFRVCHHQARPQCLAHASCRRDPDRGLDGRELNQYSGPNDRAPLQSCCLLRWHGCRPTDKA
ncbi:hypothetical protein [Variovorax sp.]|uniref:hypothetical protein n=1 Tax=Variovorax sp. TaxID=1871043 RepID=UPI0025FD7D06|nr:hypothetical protein [Variovorax sp.]